MDVVTLLVSATSMLVVAVVTSYNYMMTQQLKKDVDENMKSFVDQVNSAQFYKYKFDKLQESNIKNLDTNTQIVHENMNKMKKMVNDTAVVLNRKMQDIEKNTLKKENMTGGVDYMKLNKLRLGDQHTLSGVGDAHSAKPDGWLRLFDKDGKDYYGGLAAGKLYARDSAYVGGSADVNGSLNLRGGKSEHNPSNWGTHFPWAGDGKNYIRGDTELRGNTTNIGDLQVQRNVTMRGGKSEHNAAGWGTHFPWAGDGKNYIRGDTEIRGNTDNIGDLNVGRNMNVQGKLFFADPTRSAMPNGANNSDPYHLQKVIRDGNASSLRLTINDDPDEAFQIWGNSCVEAGGCAGPGALKHHFQANGDVAHMGNMQTRGTTTTSSVYVQPLVNDNDMNAWAQFRNGNDHMSIGMNKSVQGIVVNSGKPFGIWDRTGERMLVSEGNTRFRQRLVADQLCIGTTCLTEADLQKIKKL